MSFKIIGSAFDLPLVGNDKLVFLALCENADDNTRTCYPSYATIQRKASLVNSSLKTCLLVLEAVGLIEVNIRSTKNGGRTSTLYKINEFDPAQFDIKNYKKIAKEIRTKRNFREKRETQPPKIDTDVLTSNLRNSTQCTDYTQPPKFDTDLETQPPKFGEEPLASSFQPLALREEDEELCIGEIIPTEVIPELSPQIIEAAINEMVSKLAKSNPAAFRRRVLEKLDEGNAETIENIREFANRLNGRRRIGVNRGDPLFPPGVNMFDLIEELYGDGGAA